MISQKLAAKVIEIIQTTEGWCSYAKGFQLAEMVMQAKPLVAVEIGVFGGRSALIIAAALQELGQGVLHAVDPWAAVHSVAGWDGENARWWGNEDHEKHYSGFIERMNRLKLDERVKVHRMTSEEFAIPAGADFIHLDGNHNESQALADVNKILSYVGKGAVLVMDDCDWESTRLAVSVLDSRCELLAQVREGNLSKFYKVL